MRRVVASLAIAILCAATLCAQPPVPQQSGTAAQTARQALMEMFFGKTPGTFTKHLPAATRAALEKSGALATLQQYSQMASQMQVQGNNLQTFETGRVLLTSDDPKTGQKSDMTVESDALHGDLDDIAVTFHVYKNGQEQRTPFMPQIIFSMKQEAQVWKLNEISVTLHLPLADPDLLKALTEKMQPQPQAVVHTTMATSSETPMQPSGSDAMVVAAMRTILTAEATYAARYPSVGYTCTLSSLDGFGGGEPNERQAMLINSGLASGKKYGFVFTLSECSGAPASGFRLMAVPNGSSFGRKAFCADQAGAIRSSDDGNAATCLAHGTSIPEGTGIAQGSQP